MNDDTQERSWRSRPPAPVLQASSLGAALCTCPDPKYSVRQGRSQNTHVVALLCTRRRFVVSELVRPGRPGLGDISHRITDVLSLFIFVGTQGLPKIFHSIL